MSQRVVVGVLLVLGLARSARAADLFDSIDLVAAELKSGDTARRRDALDKLDAYGATEAAPYLYAALSDSDLEVRVKAVGSLGRHQLIDAAPRLVPLLGDPELKLRVAAAEALGLLGNAEAPTVKALERTLVDGEHEARAAAVGALGRLPATAVRPVAVSIAARLDDENVAVREQSAGVLGRLGDARAVIPLIGRLGDASREVRRAAVDALGQLGDERAAPAMIRLLRPEQPEEVRAQAVQALGRLRSRAALPPLIDLLERGPDALRGRAAFAIGQIASRTPTEPTAGAPVAPSPAGTHVASVAAGTQVAPVAAATPVASGAQVASGAHVATAASVAADPAIVALLAALGRDEARAAAREALGRVGDPAVPALVTRLRSASGDELGTVVELLRDLHDPRATPALAEELGRGRVSRERVIDALGAIARAGDRRPLVELLGLLGDSDVAIRRRTAAALRGITDGRAVAALAAATADADRTVRLAVLAELGRLKAPAALPSLLTALDKGDPETAAAAATTLGEIGDARAVQPLVAALERPQSRVRRNAADALARLRDGASGQTAAVLRLAKSGPGDRRPEAIAALGGLYRGRPDPVARELLLGLAESDDSATAVEAVAALGAMRDSSAVPRLSRLLSRSSTGPGLRRAICAALGDTGGELPPLLGRLDDDADPSVRAEAAWALGKHAADLGTLEPALTRALASPTPAVRANAAAALARLGRAPAALTALLDDRSPAARANAALALLRTASARPALERLKADDEDLRVRAAATRALGRAPAPARADWTLFHIIDFDGAALPDAPYLLTFSDGLIKSGTADARGTAREESVPAGAVELDIAEDPRP